MAGSRGKDVAELCLYDRVQDGDRALDADEVDGNGVTDTQ